VDLLLPNQHGLTNVRLGFSPFVSVRTYGDDQMDRTRFGALAELRITTEIYEYLTRRLEPMTTPTTR